MPEQTKLTLRLPSSVYWQIKQMAVADQVTMTDLILTAIAEYAAKHGHEEK